MALRVVTGVRATTVIGDFDLVTAHAHVHPAAMPDRCGLVIRVGKDLQNEVQGHRIAKRLG